MKCIFRYSASFGRSGDLDGLFVADLEDVQNAIGEVVHFGEVLGKHSDVTTELEEEDFEIMSDDPVFVKKFEDELGADACGLNPLHFVGDDDDDDDDDDEEY